MHSSPVRRGVPGVVVLACRRGFGCSLELANMWGDGQGSSCRTVRGSMVVAAEAAHAEGEAGNETVCRAYLWSVVNSDGEVGFRAGSPGTGVGSGIGCSC